MRLNLTIARNRLEPINVLWTTSNTKTPAHTISRLLADINEKFPLEADDWGLEDYVVSVNGFECLHFAVVGETLRDGDHVCIDPLESTDVRSRTLSGRQQISAAGLSLIDGVPFGKPAMRSIDRPRIHIPPRKRRRLAYDDDEIPRQITAREGTSVSLSDVDRDEEQLLLLNSGEASLIEQDSVLLPRLQGRTRKSVTFDDTMNELETSGGTEHDGDEDEEDDEEFLPDAMSGSSEEDSDDEEDMGCIIQAPPGSTPGKPLIERTKTLSVTMASKLGSRTKKAVDYPVATSISSESPDDSSDDSDSQDSDKSDASETSSDESSSEESESETNKTPIPTTRSKAAPRLSNSSNSQVSQSARSSTAPAKPTLPESKPTVGHGEGQNRTKARNQRRKLSSRLHKLKAAGELPPNASINDLRAMDNLEQDGAANTRYEVEQSITIENPGPSGRSGADSPAQSEVAIKSSNRVDGSKPTNVPQVAAAVPALLKEWIDQPLSKKASQDTEFQLRRQRLLDSLADGTLFENEVEAQEEIPSKRKDALGEADVDQIPLLEPSSKRARLDLNASRRMIFSDLGTRVPKNRAEAELTRQKLSGKLPKTSKVKQPEGPTSISVEAPAPESQAWRNKLTVRAIECVQDGIVLSEPPYPFVQRWDPQQKLPKNKGKSYKEIPADEELYDDVQGDMSYYEEDTFIEEDEPSIEHGQQAGDDLESEGMEGVEVSSATQALREQAEQQLIGDLQASMNATNDDNSWMSLPLAEELAKMPDASIADMVPGSIIAFKEFEASAATGWRPGVSPYRVAEVMKEDAIDAGAVALKLAPDYRRDAEAYYDDDGNRIYQGWEMPVAEINNEEDFDNGDRLLNFEELLECKVLRHAADQPSHAESALEYVQGAETTAGDESMIESRGSQVPDVAETPLKLQFTPRSVRASKKKAKASFIESASKSELPGIVGERNGIENSPNASRSASTASSRTRRVIVEAVIPAHEAE